MQPVLSGLWLSDFDDNLKRKLFKQFNRQFSDEELSFFAESYVKYWMNYNKNVYELIITDSLKKYDGAITQHEAKEKIYQSEILAYKQLQKDILPKDSYLINAAQLGMKEVIPYLQQYVNDSIKKYAAVCALAFLGVAEYEQQTINFFNTDENQNDIGMASVLNNQDIWYLYIQRLKSEKYNLNCPIAYETIRNLGYVLKDFPINHIRYLKEPQPGIIVPIELTPIVPDECGLSTQVEKIPINSEHIKYVVDWMETNKGKYELQKEIDKTW
jgi:hypothetical protein